MRQTVMIKANIKKPRRSLVISTPSKRRSAMELGLFILVADNYPIIGACLVIVVVVVVVSLLYPLPSSYWPIWPCLSFLPRHVRTMSWPHYKVASILDVTCCVVQTCYVHARRRHVSPLIAPRRYHCLSFLPKDDVLQHPLIVGCCVIHVVCHSCQSSSRGCLTTIN